MGDMSDLVPAPENVIAPAAPSAPADVPAQTEVPSQNAGPGVPVQNSLLTRGMRETIEAVAIALALAFLFKTFEAEEFVIPTG